MKKKKDKRVTVKHTQLIFYCSLFVTFAVVASTFLVIYYNMPRGNFLDDLYAALALITLVVVVSGIAVGVVGFTYKRFILKPVEKLTDAAQKVAEGDFSVRLAPMRKDGKKDEFELLFEDFNTMVSELNSTEILKKDFISNVSHELKTPLAVIQNFSTMLQSDGLSEAERKEYASKISEATKGLSVLVTDILQLSRLENQKIVVNRKNYNLSEQLCRCIIGFEQVWESKNIEINTDLDVSIETYADESLLDIVWNNLLSNALKFTPERGTVEISSKTENGYAVVSVSDSGCGMTEHDLKHIFDKFYQADTSHATKGNGLGLALVYEIITLLKSEITVDSTPDKGSRFTVKIPLE